MGLLAAAGLAYGAERFSYSSDGSEVTDNTTGLVWRRCAEGMSWSEGTCNGDATLYTQEAALQLGINGWRLPNIKELASIVDLSKVNPAIDPSSFPNTPTSTDFWSSSPNVRDSRNAWFVGFDYGYVYYYGRFNSGYVRLVR